MPEQEHQCSQVHSSPDFDSVITSFDELAKGLATGAVSRRKALRWMGSALVGAALTAVPGAAWAQVPSPAGGSACARFCREIFPPGPEQGQCTSQGAQGGGPCYECTPGIDSVTGPNFQCPPTRYMIPLQRTEPVAAPAEKMRCYVEVVGRQTATPSSSIVIVVLEAPSTPQAASAFARLAPSNASEVVDNLDIVSTYKVPAKVAANAAINAYQMWRTA